MKIDKLRSKFNITGALIAIESLAPNQPVIMVLRTVTRARNNINTGQKPRVRYSAGPCSLNEFLTSERWNNNPLVSQDIVAAFSL